MEAIMVHERPFPNMILSEKDKQAKEQITNYYRYVTSLPETPDLIMEEESLLHLCAEGYGEHYIFMAQYAREHGFKTVIDIGCNTGWQALYFRNYGIEFLGLDACPLKLEQDQISIKKGFYPTPLKELFSYDRESTLVISSLCLGWLDLDHRKTFQQLAHDTSFALIDMPKDAVIVAEEFFEVRYLEEFTYELTRKDENNMKDIDDMIFGDVENTESDR